MMLSTMSHTRRGLTAAAFGSGGMTGVADASGAAGVGSAADVSVMVSPQTNE
jgi:hypothetical protein